MLSPSRFHQIFRASAVYDLLISAPFAIAPGVWLIWAVMTAASETLTLPPPAPLDAHGMMFANFFGSVVALWGLLRLKLDQAWLARWDAVARGSFSLAMVLALAGGATPLLVLFLVAEVTWGVLQFLPVRGRAWRQP